MPGAVGQAVVHHVWAPLSCCCHSAIQPCCSFAERLLQFSNVFQRSSGDGGSGVAVHPRLATQQQRTEAIAAVLQQLRQEVGAVQAGVLICSAMLCVFKLEPAGAAAGRGPC